MVVRQELAALRENGHSVAVYSARSDDISEMTKAGKAAVPARVIWSVKDLRGVERILSREKFDVIHLHNPFPLISPSVLTAARKHHVPVVMTLHNYRLVCAAGTFLRNGVPCLDCLPGSPLPGLVHACYRGSLPATLPLTTSIGLHRALGTWSKGVARFIVMSRFAREIMERAGIPPEQLVVKPHFIPAPAGSGTPAERGHVLYLGRLSEEKGAQVLLDAWDSGMGKLVIAGDGPLRAALENSARRHGGSVVFTGALDRAQAMECVAGARVLVNPSMAFETFGLTVAEAFAHGVPAVVPNQGVFPELVRPGHNGRIFEAGNPESLARELRKCLAPGEAERMGGEALGWYRERFMPAANLATLENIYRDCIAEFAGAN